jgi:hypothetical protein
MIASAGGRPFSDTAKDFTTVFDGMSSPLTQEAEAANDLQPLLHADDRAPPTEKGTKPQSPPSEGSGEPALDAAVASFGRLDPHTAASDTQEPKTMPLTHPVFDTVDLGQRESTSVPPITTSDTGTDPATNDIQFQTPESTSHQSQVVYAQGSPSGNIAFGNLNAHSNGGQMAPLRPATQVSLHAVPRITDTPTQQPTQTAGLSVPMDGSSPKPLTSTPFEPNNGLILAPQKPSGDRKENLKDTAYSPTFPKSALPITTQRPSSATPNPQNVMHALQDIPSTTFAPLEDETHFAARAETLNTPLAPQTQVLHSGTHLSQHIARQIAEALQQVPSRPVEISLNPEELGRVRLAMHATETGIVVNVLAERPETIDLMRRHIASLQGAFQDIGYSDITFSFSGGDQAQDDSSAKANTENGKTLLADSDQQKPETTRIELIPGPNAGLDIRL